jgi:hypothetical protein
MQGIEPLRAIQPNRQDVICFFEQTKFGFHG